MISLAVDVGWGFGFTDWAAAAAICEAVSIDKGAALTDGLLIGRTIWKSKELTMVMWSNLINLP